jgi:hypothetical protein
MNDRERIPQDLNEIAELLQSRRPEAGPLELDRIKLRAKASRRRPALRFGKGNGFMRSRVVSLLLVTGLLGGGTGAMAAAGGPTPFDVLSSNHEGASNSQYCPPTSQQPGKPKKPGPARCGNPKTKEPPGQTNGGPGNGHGNAYGHSNGNSAVQSQGNGPGNGHVHGGGKGNGKKK